MLDPLFSSSGTSVSSDRIIYTSSAFARTSLIHLQETGTLQAVHPHKNERSGLQSCLFFTVLSGAGRLVYEGKEYELKTGDCVFIDCRKVYSHETGFFHSGDLKEQEQGLWSLQWVHFYGANMNAIYRKYQERGGKPVFQTEQLLAYQSILKDIYRIASSADYVRDMRLHEKLSGLLILLMEDAWDEGTLHDAAGRASGGTTVVDIQDIKDYFDSNYKKRITMDELAARFYINKYYLMKLFKERYGFTIKAYLNSLRITYVKQQLRFTEKTVEELAAELDIEPAYLSRLFKKVEGVSPTKYRLSWRGGRS